MANVNLIESPLTAPALYYQSNSVVNGTVDLCLDPVDSPVLFTFETERLSNNTNKAVAYLSANSLGTTVVPGDSYTIFGQTFTAADQPAANQFFAGTAADQLLIAESLADAINQNSELNWRYTATVAEFFTIYLVGVSAKYPGSQFNLQGNITASFTNNLTPIFGLFQNAVDANRGQQLQGYNYKVFVEIWQRDPAFKLEFGRKDSDASDILLATLSQNWNSTNRFTFDVSKYIKTLITPFIPSAADSANYYPFTHVPDLSGNYYLKYGEEFNGGYDKTTGNPAESVNSITNFYSRKYYIGETQPRWCAPGVYPLNVNPAGNSRYWKAYGMDDFGFESYGTVKVLSTQPEYKLRRRVNEPEYLFIHLHNEHKYSKNRNYRLKSTYTYTDGTTSAPQYTHVQNNLNSSGFHFLDLSLQRLNFSSVDTTAKRVLHSEHTVEVFRNAVWTDYTEPFTYQYDLNTEPDNYLSFYWENELGVIEQFCFEGNQIENIDIKSTEFDSSLQTRQGYFRNKPTSNVFKRVAQDKLTINSGWVDEAHYIWLQSLLKSNRVYIRKNDVYDLQWVFNINPQSVTEYIAVNISDFNWSRDEQETLFNLSVTVTEAIEKNTRES